MKENISLKKGKNNGNKEIRSFILNHNKNYSIKTNNINNLTKANNLRIINKKKANKREEMLSTIKKTNQYTFFLSSVSPQSKSPYRNEYINLNSYSSKSCSKMGQIFNAHHHFMSPDKEGLVAELYHINNDMEIQNKELDDLKNKYNNCINNSLEYISIIEKILKSDKSGNYINSNNSAYDLKYKEKSKSENNFNRIRTIIKENDEFLPTKTMYFNLKFYKNNTINNDIHLNLIKNNNNTKTKSKLFLKNSINILKKQKADLNRLLIEKERFLIKIKNNKKNKIFDEYIVLLNEMNIQQEILLYQIQKLEFTKNEGDNLINIYLIKIKKFVDEINSLNDKIKMNKNDLEIIKKDIDSLLKCKEELKQKKIKLYENEKQNKDNFKKKQKKENEIDNLLKEKKKFFEEQEKIELQIKDLKKKENKFKKFVERSNLTIKGIRRENEDLTKQIIYYEERRNKLLEKADRPRKNRIRMKEMENEIKDLEKIIVNYKVENDEKETNMEQTIEKNNETIENQETIINNHVNEVKDLETIINGLKDELKKVEENNSKIGEVLLKIEGEYKEIQEHNKQEKEKKEKIKKEKEELYNEYLKNKKELSEEAEKLKTSNNQMKEENKKLKDSHKEKMELYKLANAKKAQLEKLLEEIKELSAVT